MPLDEFIITVFCWVAQGLETVTDGVKLRTRGFAPRVSDSEVITMELVGELLGYAGDEAIWKYFKQHGAAWFPRLGERTTFLRQAANLCWVKHYRLQTGARRPEPRADSRSRVWLLCRQGGALLRAESEPVD